MCMHTLMLLFVFIDVVNHGAFGTVTMDYLEIHLTAKWTFFRNINKASPFMPQFHHN